MLITAEIKDRILKWLVEKSEQSFPITYDWLETSFEIPEETAKQIIDQFHDLQYIERRSYLGGASVVVKASAHDFYQRGGFTVQEEMFKDAYNRLYLEIDTLKKELSDAKFPEKAERFTSILANLSTVATFLGITIHH